MTYTNDGTVYHPAPYATAPAANVYYKILGRDSYVLSSSINVGNTQVNRTFGMLQPMLEDAIDVPGDYYSGERFEYLEMVSILQRVDSGGSSDPDGKYVLDSIGRAQPIRTLYTPAYYRIDGKYIGSTFPDMERGDQSDEDFARTADLSDNPAEVMTVEDYIAVFKREVTEQLRQKKVDVGPWYSGPTSFTVTFTETEFDINGNPVEVKKSKTVEMTEIVPETYHAEYKENIMVDPTLNSAITAITPDDQRRNPFGLYNVHGNVAEWVDTTWDGLSDLSLHKTGDYQIVRGGSWRTGAQYCRSAARDGRKADQAYDDVGFRFILTE
jgi:hypothetical protein